MKSSLIVIDSCVWISAFVFRRTLLEVVRIATLKHRILLCDEIEQEVRRVLEQKFRFTPEQISYVLEVAWSDTRRVQLRGNVFACRDPKDNMILDCAGTGMADLILTSDNDLLSMKSYLGIPILNARAFWDANQ